MNRCIWPLLCLLLLGCGKDLPLPPAKPLALSSTAIDAMHGAAPGPYAVVALRDLALATDSGDALAASLYFPQGDGGFPLLLFSHGNWSTNNKYDELLSHWVSHGYAVLAPLHMDGSGGYLRGTVNLVRYGNLPNVQPESPSIRDSDQNGYP